jgi:pSer/pThr/pTyr-binding forkhead associated (FHA) protein
MTIKNIITIGRGHDADYRIDNESVSKEHALLIVSNGSRDLLIDCASTNGTRLISKATEQRVFQSEVYPEDTVFFGDREHLVKDIIACKNTPDFVGSEKNFTRIRDPFDGSIKSRPK